MLTEAEFAESTSVVSASLELWSRLQQQNHNTLRIFFSVENGSI